MGKSCCGDVAVQLWASQTPSQFSQFTRFFHAESTHRNFGLRLEAVSALCEILGITRHVPTLHLRNPCGNTCLPIRESGATQLVSYVRSL